jgi:cytoskeleton protein RodZ
MADRHVSSFGAQLRKAREAKGLSLAHIAAVTKISVRALEAVERNDYSRLPGGIFTRSFVRAYAGEVGLNPDAALKAFLAECPEDIAAIPTSAPESIDGATTERWYDRVPWGRLAMVGLIVVAIGGSGVYLYSRRDAQPRQTAPVQTAVHVEPLAPTVTAAPTTAPTPAPSSAAPDPAPPVRAPQPPSAAAIASVPQLDPAPSQTPAAVPAAEGNLTLGLTASAPCWVELTVDSKPTDARMFTQGEHLLVRVDTLAVVKVGDAASMQLTINGRPGRSLGRPGQVTTIRVTPDNYQDFLPSDTAH